MSELPGHDRVAGPAVVGMALYGDLTFDSRVRREAATLAREGYAVRIACLADRGGREDLPANVTVDVVRPTASRVLPGGPNPLAGSGRRSLRTLAGRARWLAGYSMNLRAWGRKAMAAVGPADAWHLHDLPALIAVGPHVAGGQVVVYDAHELFLDSGTAQRLPAVVRMPLRAYERRLASRASAVVTVNDSLAEVLQQRCRPARIEVVRNCPPRWDPPLRRSTLIRDATRIPAGSPIVLYHGGLGPHRGIEPLMEAILEPGLELVHLVLLGFGEERDAYRRAARDPRWGGRVHLLDPVPPSELLEWVSSADVGGMLIDASTPNHILSTPNKLFECLAAGVPVVASDFPAIRSIVLREPRAPVGALADPADVSGIARALQAILDASPSDRAALRRTCLSVAREHWNWESEARTLTLMYADLLRAGAGSHPEPAGRPAVAGTGRRPQARSAEDQRK